MGFLIFLKAIKAESNTVTIEKSLFIKIKPSLKLAVFNKENIKYELEKIKIILVITENDPLKLLSSKSFNR